MRSLLESDVGFYYAVGAFVAVIFVIGLATLAVLSPAGIGARELGGLVVGFLLFMVVYFISITIHQLEKREEL
ncbi:hypothetical protein [Halopiger xanaduensis]|uniref:Uncharacterized protein n=1 Tax=Halopiger xanaduensis (strain DSM 18323 / JCM 14033 / SH-6) TaxID=797210 RepID=F8D407_HALXS|nr:hypothetical protein [Halopiger xanaduensis]AEH36260.1 hypothetical protein Halxa_1628 [Halopiger xanaduensis SH-6]